MRYWMVPDPGHWPGYAQLDNGYHLRDTPAYIEYVMPTEQSVALSFYWLRVTDHDYFIGMCWDHDFDFPIHMLMDAKVGPGVANSMSEGWPTFMALLMNSSQDHPRFSQGVMSRIVDPDDHEMKWFVGTILGNHPIEDSEQLFSERSLGAANRVLQLCAFVGDEQLKVPFVDLPNLAVNSYNSARKKDVSDAARFVARYSARILGDTLPDVISRMIDGE